MFYIPNYKTAISDKITFWEGEQFSLSAIWGGEIYQFYHFELVDQQCGNMLHRSVSNNIFCYLVSDPDGEMWRYSFQNDIVFSDAIMTIRGKNLICLNACPSKNYELELSQLLSQKLPVRKDYNIAVLRVQNQKIQNACTHRRILTFV